MSWSSDTRYKHTLLTLLSSIFLILTACSNEGSGTVSEAVSEAGSGAGSSGAPGSTESAALLNDSQQTDLEQTDGSEPAAPFSDAAADLTNDILVPPDAPEFSVTAQSGQLQFTWQPQPQNSVISIELYDKKLREIHPIVQFADSEITSYSLKVDPLAFAWQDMEFILQVCGSTDCVRSYSVAVDHLASASALKLTATETSEFDLFASSLTSSALGNVIVAGIPGANSRHPVTRQMLSDAGTAELYFEIEGQWWPGALLQPSNPSANSQFGSSLAVDSVADTVVVGAPLQQVDNTLAGAVFVFERLGGTWLQTRQLNAQLPSDAASFGTSVAISADGQTIAVGAPADSIRHLQAGSVSVFKRDSISRDWMLTQVLHADNGEGGQTDSSGRRFGQQLSLDSTGERLVISAPGEMSTSAVVSSSGEQPIRGAIHVYSTNNSAGLEADVSGEQRNYTLTQKITHHAFTSKSLYAESVKLSSDGSTLLSSLQTRPELTERGSTLHKPLSQVQILRLDASGQYQPETLLTPAGTHSSDSRLAISVDGSGHMIVLGVSNPGSTENVVSVFSWINSSWQSDNQFSNPQPAANDFARSLHLSDDGSTLVVGAESETNTDGVPVPASGALYIY